MQRHVPTVQRVQKTAEVPQLQSFDKVVGVLHGDAETGSIRLDGPKDGGGSADSVRWWVMTQRQMPSTQKFQKSVKHAAETCKIADERKADRVKMFTEKEQTVGGFVPQVQYIDKLPHGTVIPSVEEKAADRGRLARTAGTSRMIAGHSDDGCATLVRLSSGSQKTMTSTGRAIARSSAGGGRMDEPVLKAGPKLQKLQGEAQLLTQGPRPCEESHEARCACLWPGRRGGQGHSSGTDVETRRGKIPSARARQTVRDGLGREAHRDCWSFPMTWSKTHVHPLMDEP